MIEVPHPPPGVSTGPYGLVRPDLDEARAALDEVYGEGANEVWTALLRRAGLSGRETDPVSLDRLITAMKGADPVTALCGRSLAIRVASFDAIATDRELSGSLA